MHEDQRAERLQRWPREIAAFERSELLFQFCSDRVDQSARPGDENGRTGRMFGLGDEVGRREVGPRRFVGDDDHLARPGDRIDVDFAEDMFLGQGDEQVAGADDLVDAVPAPSTP